MRRNDAKAVRDALDSGADANARDYTDPHFCAIAVINDWTHGRKPNLDAPTALMIALDQQEAGRYKYGCLPENTDLVRVLLDHGADSHRILSNRMTVVEMAAACDKADTVQLLLDRDGSTTTINDLNVALVAAVYSRCPNSTDVLLRRGADANTKTNDGWTMLMRATEAGQTRIVRSLLLFGANPNCVGPMGQTAASVAMKSKRREISSLLKHAPRR